jgi:hypothetical protein
MMSNVIGRKNFEFAFITACRKNNVRAAYVVFEADRDGGGVALFVGGEEISCGVLKKIVAAGEHAVARRVLAESTAEARLDLLFGTVPADNSARLDWAAMKQEIARLRGALGVVVAAGSEADALGLAERAPYWPRQSECGDCVLCGAGSVLEPAKTVAEHAPQCGFRRAVEALSGQ